MHRRDALGLLGGSGPRHALCPVRLLRVLQRLLFGGRNSRSGKSDSTRHPLACPPGRPLRSRYRVPACRGKRPGPAVVRNRILKETRPGSIVLSHDIHPGTIEAMPSTFNELEAKGFKFVTVSELIDMATPETPHPKAQTAEKTAAKAAPSPKPAASPNG